jgi:hypothetical protein
MKAAGTTLGVKRIVLVPCALVILFGLWYAFRPEKLFINKKVDEAAPSASIGQPEALFTGRFGGQPHKTMGRATIFRKADGSRYLHLSNFSTSDGPVLHVLLVNGTGIEADKDFELEGRKSIDLGELKTTKGEQDYALTPAVDPIQFDTAAIYSIVSHSNFGSARLESLLAEQSDPAVQKLIRNNESMRRAES